MSVRVAHVISTPTGMGGAERVLSSLAHAIEGWGWPLGGACCVFERPLSEPGVPPTWGLLLRPRDESEDAGRSMVHAPVRQGCSGLCYVEHLLSRSSRRRLPYLLFKPDDVDEMRRTLERALGDAVRAADVEHCGARMENFDVERVLDVFEELLTDAQHRARHLDA